VRVSQVAGRVILTEAVLSLSSEAEKPRSVDSRWHSSCIGWCVEFDFLREVKTASVGDRVCLVDGINYSISFTKYHSSQM